MGVLELAQDLSLPSNHNNVSKKPDRNLKQFSRICSGAFDQRSLEQKFVVEVFNVNKHEVETFDRWSLVVPYVLGILAKIFGQRVPSLFCLALNFPITVSSA